MAFHFFFFQVANVSVLYPVLSAKIFKVAKSPKSKIYYIASKANGLSAIKLIIANNPNQNIQRIL